MPKVAKEFLLKDARKNRVICCEDMNFIWDAPELKELAEMWESRTSVKRIAEHFDRDSDEVLVALIHLAREFKITKRRGGLF